ncbi:MAG: class II SORL domain-containing protein [Promethearchaeota archaeon]
MTDLFQTADWSTEKHAPAIEVDGNAVKVSVGKQVPHPNTTNHHIRWIQLLFLPEGAKFPVEVGKADFTAHGAGADGPDTSTIYCEPTALFSLKSEKPGKLIAFSYCNLHGLWESTAEFKP